MSGLKVAVKKRIPAFLLAIASLLATDLDAAPRRRAVLVGINDYSATQLGAPLRHPPPDRDWRDLSGAAGDVEMLSQLLVLLYGFDERDIVTLTDQRATRDAILRAIQQQLVQPAAKNDVIVFYFAGHGSQVRNTLSDELDRMDESIVPADSRVGGRDIRDKELRRLFNAALDKGARLTVILDNCYSGSGARGLPTGARPRAVKPDLHDLRDRTPHGPRPESRGALVLSAAQDFGEAWETRDATGRIHGAFSWALMLAMREAAASETAADTFLRARARLRAETPFQEPVIAGSADVRLSPFLGVRGGPARDHAIVAIEKVQRDGTVVLQGGWANGLSVGSELSVVTDRAITARLHITSLLGLGRSEARIAPERALPAAVKSGALLEVVGWAATPGQPLRVWMPRVPGNAGAIASLARQLLAESTRRGLRWVTDPVELTPTHVLRRNGNQWELLAPDGTIGDVGSDFAGAIAAIAKVPRGSSLFVQFPVPAAMIDGIAVGPGTDREDFEPVEHPESADYVLVGRLSSRRLEYAWVRPAVTTADQRKTGLPLRSDWIAEDGRDSVPSLREAVLRLRRIHAWSLLESPPGERWPYRLGLRHMRTGEPAKDVLIGDDAYEIVLRGVAPLTARARQRYVYVFVVDSHGRSTLLFPRADGGSVENRLPLSLPGTSEIRLGRNGAFEVAPPYGVDTYFLLTTDEALSTPSVLEWNGIRTRAPETPTPLERLLMLTDSTSRMGLSVTPTTWSLERVSFESIPPRTTPQKR